jgi:hypothetical protein
MLKSQGNKLLATDAKDERGILKNEIRRAMSLGTEGYWCLQPGPGA